MISVQSFAASDKGSVRHENEDSYSLHVPDDEAILQRRGSLLLSQTVSVGAQPENWQARWLSNS